MMDLWDDLFSFLGDLFGEVGIFFVSWTVIIIVVLLYIGWWEWVR